MSRFMPADATLAQELEHRLSETLFRSPESFVQLYNEGLVNKKHKDIARIAADICRAYKNVREKGGTLIFLSRAEVLIDEVAASIEEWTGLVRARRELTALVTDETLTRDDVVYLAEDAGGFILRRSETEEGAFDKLGAERSFTKAQSIPALHARYSSAGQPEDGLYPFRVSDFLNLDDSFIEQVANLLPR